MHTEESLAVFQCLRVPCVNSDVFHVAPQNAPCYLWRTKGELHKGPFLSESLAVRRAEPSAAITRVHEVLDAFAARDEKGEMLTAVRHFPAREAQWADFPSWVHPDLVSAYAEKGISRLYTHQAEAAEAVHAEKNVVIVTPTASGKTLCYNLPVINAILENEDTRALYLFPTKALAQDQLAELYDVSQRLEGATTQEARTFGVFTYDGDT